MVSVEHVFSTRVYLETQAAEGIIASMHPDKAAALREEAIRPDPGEDIGVGAERFHALLAALSSNPVIEMLLPILSGLISDVSSAAIARMSARVRKQVWREVTHEHSLIAEAIIAGDLPAVRRHLTAHLITSHKALPPGNPVVIIRELTGG
jgi:DNA-binding FadR family transcriptional regulator